MKKILFLVSLCLLLAVLVYANGLHKKGVVKITVDVDTLNDTASGSGLAVYPATTLYGFNFVNYKNILGRIILMPSANAAHGYGLEDSAIVWLQHDKFDSFVTIDSAVCGGLPCTLLVDSVSSNLGSALSVRVYMNDTCSDTVMDAVHEIQYEFIVRE